MPQTSLKKVFKLRSSKRKMVRPFNKLSLLKRVESKKRKLQLLMLLRQRR